MPVTRMNIRIHLLDLEIVYNQPNIPFYLLQQIFQDEKKEFAQEAKFPMK